MSRFCSFCGKELTDGQCDCAEFLAQAKPVVQSEPIHKEPITFKGIVNELLASLKGLLKSKDDAAKELSFISMGIFAVGGFIFFTLAMLLFFVGMGVADYMESSFGTSLLLGLITVIYSMIAQSAIVVGRKVIKKEPMKFAADWFNLSAVNVLVYSIITFLGSIFALMELKFGLLFVLIVSICTIVDTATMISKSETFWKQALRVALVTVSTIIFGSIFFDILSDGLGLGLLNMLF